mmetsp:Transcript_50175/g.125112  ORF Transcript_50175/g.125112 Transcript_50175/m.125112 type:complete len:224 (-) Transcript_50175:61-732(-)
MSRAPVSFTTFRGTQSVTPSTATSRALPLLMSTGSLQQPTGPRLTRSTTACLTTKASWCFSSLRPSSSLSLNPPLPKRCEPNFDIKWGLGLAPPCRNMVVQCHCHSLWLFGPGPALVRLFYFFVFTSRVHRKVTGFSLCLRGAFSLFFRGSFSHGVACACYSKGIQEATTRIVPSTIPSQHGNQGSSHRRRLVLSHQVPACCCGMLLVADASSRGRAWHLFLY